MNAADSHIDKNGFRLRGTALSRVDGFSDVVFGFALTLLVVSLEVPKTYAELHANLLGFLPFALSFTLLIMIWFAHFHFFRRFGLDDNATIIINAVLLFVILFFVYPLKFLFNILLSSRSAPKVFQTDQQARELMVLYGLGYMVVYLLLAALYLNAWRQRHDLQLNRVERALTFWWILDHAGTAGVALLSVAAAFLLPIDRAGYAGFIFFLMPVVKTVQGTIAGHRMRLLRAQEAERANATINPPPEPSIQVA